MNRWTGTGHLTKDPKFLETDSGTAICTLRIAVKRAGKQGQDGYFDVKCFDGAGVGVRAVPQGGTRGRRRRAAAVRRVPDPGRRVRLPGLHRGRARRVPRQPQDRPPVRPATRPPRTARQDGAARERAGRLTTIAGPRRSTGRGPDDFPGDRHDHHDHHPTAAHETAAVPRRARRASGRRGADRAALPARRTGSGWGSCSNPPRGCGGLATRAIALGRRTDVYVGCAPRTRRHGGRDAVARAFVLWADCDGDAAVAALRATSSRRRRSSSPPGPGRNCHAYWPLRDPIAADELERANRRLAHALGADPASADAARILRVPGTLSHKHQPPTPVEAIRLDPDRRLDVADVVGALPDPPRTAARAAVPVPARDGEDPLLAIAPEVYVRRLLGRRGAAPSQGAAARSTPTGMQACMSTTPRSAAGTASAPAAAAARSTTSPPPSTATRARRGLPAPARRAAPPLRPRGGVMIDAPPRTTSSTSRSHDARLPRRDARHRGSDCVTRERQPPERPRRVRCHHAPSCRRYARGRFDERFRHQPDRRRGPALGGSAARIARLAPRHGALERRIGGRGVAWYADEILICEGDLVGKTREQLRSLHFRRDRDWLQS